VQETGFWGSLSDSWHSMQQTYTSLILVHWYGMSDEGKKVMDQAYKNGPLGQTRNSSVVYYYGTRGALRIATAAATAATSVLAYDAVVATGSGQIIITRLYGQVHVVYREVGGAMYHALGRTGATQISAVTFGEAFTVTFWNTITIPLRNPGAVTTYSEMAIATGLRYYNCATAAVKFILTGL